MRKLALLTIIGGSFALVASQALAIGLPAKAKAKKIQGDLVPAFAPEDTGSNTGDDENDDPALLDVAIKRSPCSFVQGKFKLQLGKDGTVQLKGVECNGTPYTGQLCAHTKQLATIMTEEIPKKGDPTPKTCMSGAVPLQGRINYSTGNIGLINCTDGKCKGTLQVVTTDPCPDVDKVSELRRFEVFDGPDKAEIVTLGTLLTACCGPGQTTVGGSSVSGVAPCDTSTQDVMAEMGIITQGVNP